MPAYRPRWLTCPECREPHYLLADEQRPGSPLLYCSVCRLKGRLVRLRKAGTKTGPRRTHAVYPRRAQP